jgi:beta-lactamase regulating signal transducer with metallopeptidase domain
MVIHIIDEFSIFLYNFLLKQSVYTAILFIILSCISAFLVKKSPYWNYGLWLLVFIRLILPTDLNFTYSARNMLDRVPDISNATAVLESVTSIEYHRQNRSTGFKSNNLS